MKFSMKKNEDICKMLLYAILALVFVNMIMNIMAGRSCFDMNVMKNVGTLASPSPSPNPPSTTVPISPGATTTPSSPGATTAPGATGKPINNNPDRAPPNVSIAQRKQVAPKAKANPPASVKPTTQPIVSQRVLESEKMGANVINNPESGLSMQADVLDGNSKFESGFAPWNAEPSKVTQQQNKPQRPSGVSNGKVNQSALNAMTGNGDVNKAQNGGSTKATPRSTGAPLGTGKPVGGQRNTMMADNGDSASGFAAPL